MTERDLAPVPTVFDQLHPKLIDALVDRGWWLNRRFARAVAFEVRPLKSSRKMPSPEA